MLSQQQWGTAPSKVRGVGESIKQKVGRLWFCAKAFDCVDHNKLWKILQEMGIPDHLTCLLRNLYAGQEATVRTGHGTMGWFHVVILEPRKIKSDTVSAVSPSISHEVMGSDAMTAVCRGVCHR